MIKFSWVFQTENENYKRLNLNGLLMLIILIIFSHTIRGQEFKCSYLSVEDGLSQNEVTSIVQDKYGFIWIGTRGGLNKYDGYSFKHYKPNVDSENTIINPSIERLFIDSQNKLWIGTKSGGFSVYDLLYENFLNVDHLLEKSPKRIISINEGSNKDIWLGSWGNGVCQFSMGKDTLLRKYPDLDNNKISKVVQSHDGVFWLGTNLGLVKVLPDNKHESIKLLSGSHQITDIVVDKNNPNELWLVGWKSGLIRFNIQTKQFEVYHLPVNDNELDTYSLLEDRQGRIWVGTWGNGLFIFNKETKKFRKIDIAPKDGADSNSDFETVLDIIEDKVGDIWVGTDGGGIVRLSPRKNFYTLNSVFGLSNSHVTSIAAFNEDIAISTKGSGLIVVDKSGKTIPVYYDSLKFSYEGKKILKCVISDPNGRCWVGGNNALFIAQKDKKGAYILTTAEKYFKSTVFKEILKIVDVLAVGKNELFIGTQQRGLFHLIREDESSPFMLKKQFMAYNSPFASNRISFLKKGKGEEIWIGTYDGLYVYSNGKLLNSDSLLIHHVNSLCSIVLSMEFDKAGNIWYGTPCSLNKLEKYQGHYKLKIYNKHNGLSDDYVNAILVDSKGIVWASTNKGISSIDEKNSNEVEIRNFSVDDGIGGYNFSENACLNTNGSFYFGSYSGVTLFSPDDIIKNNYVPPLVVTKFSLLNQPIESSNNGVISKNLNEQTHITLTHNEREFSFEFAALDYSSPQSNQYAYKLEGYNEDWVNIGKRRFVSFNNLSAGNYVLRLKGSNSNGYWGNNVHSVYIKLLPPFWKTWYAFILYCTLIFGMLFIIRWNTIRHERLVRSLELEKVKAEQERKLNEMKMLFFTNVSHELKTPLTLIYAPVAELKKEIAKLSEGQQKRIELIYQNTNRLLKLVNQILDFRKSESGKIKLQASENDVHSFLYEIILPFKELAKINNIKLEIDIKVFIKKAWFDIEKMEAILNNLLSNAFKFTSGERLVCLTVFNNTEHLIYEIFNTGQGIAEEEQEKVFDRFHQTKEGMEKSGSGIGLSITKSYVELHKGTITLNNEKNGGIKFTVTLPYNDRYLSDNEKVDFINKNNDLGTTITLEEIQQLRLGNNDLSNRKSLLVVEDNFELQQYLSTLFEPYYNIVCANNGQEGYEKAIAEHPEIIVSDVMMPEMDGFEFCEKIKSNDITSTIPVILLTAKTANKFQILGIEKGADAYVTKPFDPQFLLAKTSQLLSAKRNMQKKFSKQMFVGPKHIEVSSYEEKLLNKTNRIIEQNISNQEFDVKDLAGQLSMSMATLYRKLNPIIDQTPAEYIRFFRLQKAMQLLEDRNLTLTEIAEMVGFGEMKVFRRSFKKQFGKNPSEYR